MTTNPYNALAAYPDDHQTATAEELCRNYAVLCQANFLMSLDGPTPEIRSQAILSMIGNFSVVTLLRAFTELVNGEEADAATRELVEGLDSPESIGPQIWEWLTGYGIDPLKVNEITARLPDMKPEPEMVSVRKDDLRRHLDADHGDMDASVAGLKRLWTAAGIES